MPVSLRAAVVLLSLGLTVIATGVTAYLSIASGLRALDATKDTMDTNLHSCFASGESNTLSVSFDMMDKIMANVQGRMDGLVRTPSVVAKSVYQFLHTVPAAVMTDQSWQKAELRPFFFPLVRGLTGVASEGGVFTRRNDSTCRWCRGDPVATVGNWAQLGAPPNGQLDRICDVGQNANNVSQPYYDGVQCDMMAGGQSGKESAQLLWWAEEPHTVNNPPDGTHTYQTLTCHADDPMCLMAVCDDNGVEAMIPWIFPAMALESQGPMMVPEMMVDLKKFPLIQLAAYMTNPDGSPRSRPGVVHWDHISGHGPYTLAAHVYIPIAAPHHLLGGGNIGYVMFAVNVQLLSRFIQETALPPRSRMYAVQCHPGDLSTGVIAGLSHGNQSSGVIEDPGKGPIILARHILNSTDALIRQHAHSIIGQTGGAYAGGNTYGFGAVPKEWTPAGGELYDVRASVISDNWRPEERTGLFFDLLLMIPRAETMKTIDAANVELWARINDANSKTDKDAETDLLVLVAVLAVVFVALICAGVLFGVAIARPLTKLEQDMKGVATMHLDGIDFVQDSNLAEVRSMQKSFRRMVTNMKEFRNYMPASLLQDGYEGTGGEEEEEELYANEKKSTVASQKSRSRQSRSTRQGGRPGASTVAHSVASSQSAAMRAFMQKTTAEGLKKKGVTLSVVNVCGWHTILPDSKSDHAVYDVHRSFLSSTVYAVATSKGVVDVFMGDRVCASYNAVKPCGGHRLNGCQGMMSLRNPAKEAQDTTASHNTATHSDVKVSCSVSSGDVKVGNMGTDGLKKFTFLSPVVSFAYALERFGRVWSSSESGLIPGPPCDVILCDKRVYDVVTGSFFMRNIGQVDFPKRSAKPIDVHEVLSAKAVSEDEWMYQLEEGQKSDTNAAFNDAVQAAVTGDLAAAAAKIAEVAEKDASQFIVRRMAAAVRAQVAAQTALLPTHISFH